MDNARKLFGNIDIYLFDQILKDRFNSEMSILDAGCGAGRNLVYFLRNDYQVFAVDRQAEAIGDVRHLAGKLAPNLPALNFQVSAIEKMPFSDGRFDAVLSSAVLHFAAGPEHFMAMFTEMWRVLKPGGLLIARLASSIGIEKLIEPVGHGRYLLPDGSERYLADERMLISLTEDTGGSLLEPIKTTNVQNMRCMTTWVVRKNS